MSQFPGTFGDPYADPMDQPRKTSGLAIASLVCGILGCCPFITSLLAVILGAAAFASIGKNPARRGKGLAAIGLILGLIGLVVWTLIAVYGTGLVKDMMEFVENGPDRAIKAGAAGDNAGFKAVCWGNAASASDQEVEQFFAELESRYGSFVGCRFDEQQAGSKQPTFGNPIVPFPYKLEFANKTVDSTIEIAFSDPQQGGFMHKIASITVHDEQLGDVKYPAKTGNSRGGGGASATAPATRPGANGSSP
jgi:hypothetical protein